MASRKRGAKSGAQRVADRNAFIHNQVMYRLVGEGVAPVDETPNGAVGKDAETNDTEVPTLDHTF